MPVRLVTHIVEPGFVWLKKENGFWTGWKECPGLIGESREVGVITFGGIEYRVQFLYIEPPRDERGKWKGLIDDPSVEHFDFWGLPREQMAPFEAEYLSRLLAEFCPKPEHESAAKAA